MCHVIWNIKFLHFFTWIRLLCDIKKYRISAVLFFTAEINWESKSLNMVENAMAHPLSSPLLPFAERV
jgi:hypothetical protein